MITVVVLSAAFLSFSGPASCVEVVPPAGPAVVVSENVSTPAVVPAPPAVLNEKSLNSSPENPLVLINATNSSETDNVTLGEIIDGNLTVHVTVITPNSVENENPEISARKQNLPGISDNSFSRRLLGAKCTNDSHCTVPNSFCQGTACVCKDGFRASKLKLEACVQIPKALNDSCESSSECDLAVHSSECIENRCLCPGNYVADQGVCWESKGLGAACENTIQCNEILNAACLQGVCACPVDYVPSPMSNKCLQLVKEGLQSTCSEDIQCTSTMGDNARCSNNACICKDNYHFNSSKCIEDLTLGSPCENNIDCAVSLSTEPAGQRACLNNNCTCATGFRVLKGEDHCVKGAADQITVSLSWMICVIIAKYFI